MNRELVFRAWHTVNKVMFEHSNIPVLLKNASDDNIWKYMQWTGLQDIESIDIYEGDIVRLNVSSQYLKEGSTAEVQYLPDYGGYAIVGAYSRNQHHELLTCDVACRCKVIGNIYENPYLLK